MNRKENILFYNDSIRNSNKFLLNYFKDYFIENFLLNLKSINFSEINQYFQIKNNDFLIEIVNRIFSKFYTEEKIKEMNKNFYKNFKFDNFTFNLTN